MYIPATKQVVLTPDVKWHVFDRANAANDPTHFYFTEGTGHKTNIRYNVRSNK